jgi:hypothetical protein
MILTSHISGFLRLHVLFAKCAHLAKDNNYEETEKCEGTQTFRFFYRWVPLLYGAVGCEFR